MVFSDKSRARKQGTELTLLLEDWGGKRALVWMQAILQHWRSMVGSGSAPLYLLVKTRPETSVMLKSFTPSVSEASSPEL